MIQCNRRFRHPLFVLIAGAALTMVACGGGAASPEGEPWGNDGVTPAAFMRELSEAAAGDTPVVLFTGPAFLFRQGHIPGAVLIGPPTPGEGLENLSRWAASADKASRVVLYCGCCPLNVCPNVRPAYKALKDLGFTHVRVLLLERSFAADWAHAGGPVVR